MSAEAQEYADTQNVSLKDAVIEELCIRVAYVCGYILAFLLIHILLTVIGNLPNLSYKLPDMDLVNDIGGASLGVFTGFLFCLTMVWALEVYGYATQPGDNGRNALCLPTSCAGMYWGMFWEYNLLD